MKIFKRLTFNQTGMSLVAILGSITLGLGGITYVIKEAIPKLQSEKKKIDSQLSYRMFISSVNDYLVHAIRERWCVNYDNGESDLLLSTKCSGTASMEDVVTFPGNLERVLWDEDTIGTKLSAAPAPESANKILALNYLRYHKTPKKASRLLNYTDVAPTDGILKFKISERIFKDMNDNHPLYIMSRKIFECVNSIDIEVFQVKDFANLANGDEKKIGIRIVSDIKMNRLSCLAVKRAESVSYYTFYPRRLHTFSLVKYGDLSGDYFNEFHGPVYIAGNFVLPPKDADKDKTTVFYNSLILGIYNGGSKNNILAPGTVKQSNNTLYTFPERGHPYKSKQDSYESFRGFLGGLKLDSSEDKGFHNLFDYSSSSAADTSMLEACIEDNQAILNKSKNANSKFLYNILSRTSDETLFKLSFDRVNRFALSSNSAKITYNSNDYKYQTSNYNFSMSNPNNETLAELTIMLKFRQGSYGSTTENYRATLGDGTSVKLNLDFDKYNITRGDLSNYIKDLEKVTKNNFKNAVNADVLTKTSRYQSYVSATQSLVNRCNQQITVDCKVLDYKIPKCTSGGGGGGTGGSSSTGGSSTGGSSTGGSSTGGSTGAPMTDEECAPSKYANELNKFNEKRDDLLDYLRDLRSYQINNEASLEIGMTQVAPHKGQVVLNQRNLNFKTPKGWQEYQKLIYGDLLEFETNLYPYHYGSWSSLRFKLDLMSSSGGNNLRIVKTNNFWSDEVENLRSGWTDTKRNNSESTPSPLVELQCPQGMGMADWDLDMSSSTNFAWNYANTPPGAFVNANDHQQAAPIIFDQGTPPLEGHIYSTTKSVVEECIIPADRTHVYGFYVCNKLTIRPRTKPLYMIGTFIVGELSIPKGLAEPIHWYSVWDTKATDLIMTDLNATKTACKNVPQLTSKTWKDVIVSPQITATVDSCGPLDLVSNGPNNFSWTTVDPDVGIGTPGDIMTSQKVNRIQKWVIREDSRSDLIR